MTRINSAAGSSGFTLIELIIVIVVLGVISVTAMPRYLDLSEDAHHSVFMSSAAAFKEGVNQINLAWRIRGNGQEHDDFLPVPDFANGTQSVGVNASGYPVEIRDDSGTTDGKDDCEDIWSAVLSTQGLEANPDGDQAFEVDFTSPGTCVYSYVSNPLLWITYRSETGQIVVSS